MHSAFRALLWFACAAGLIQAQMPSPALVVLNKEDATLVVVDPQDGKIVGKVATGEGPHEVAVSDDGKLAFVGNYGGQTPGHTISVIDLPERKELHRFDVTPLLRPHGMFFADGRLYFTAEMNKLIGRYDPAANRIDWLLGTGQNTTHMVMLSKDRTRMFTANIGSDSITILERGSNPMDWNETAVPVGKGPEGFDLSPDGRELWAAHSRDGGVSIIDIAAKKVTATLNVGTRRSNRLKFTPDGKRVFISDLDAGEILVLDVAGRKEIRRIKVGKSPEGILVTPDGSRVYAAVTGDNFLAVIDPKTLEIVARLHTGTGPDGMAWIAR
jgi:YVTN family beta-propeller protein